MQRLLLIISCLLFACAEEQPASVAGSYSLNDLLGGSNTAGFLRAELPRDFVFPKDHSGHEGYRNEWWYITGNLSTEQGRRFAYQITFFNTAVSDANPDSLLTLEEVLSPSVSAWSNKRFWMAHVAITDVENSQHRVFERFSRESPGLAGVQLDPFKVWLEDWTLQSQSNEFPWRLLLSDESFSLDFSISPVKPLVLQGIEGLSQKSPEPGNASYYYSYTRLHTQGELNLDGEVFELEGESWLDREWSTSALAEDQTGWDWFSLQFNDGQELMYYQLRDGAGLAHASSQGNWINEDSTPVPVYPADIQLQVLKQWQSASGVSYATEWGVSYEGNDWVVKAVIEDQLMDVLVEYWEGAVEVFSAETGEKLGQGFVEMVHTLK